MKSKWNDQDANQYSSDLELRVYTSRLLGQDKSLVLHGGGNTSVKSTITNILGESEEILYVKGSGWDLETIEAEGFAPVKLKHLCDLAELPKLSDPEMVNELKTHCLKASAPTPSVETILHALLPYKFVDHTHADAVVTITNTENGEAKIRAIYQDDMVIIPYVMPGFDLARICADIFKQQATEKTIGMVLLNHGIFSFGDTAKMAYNRMIDLVNRAENYLKQNNAWELQLQSESASLPPPLEIAEMRQSLSKSTHCPMIVSLQNDDKALAFAQHPKVHQLSQQGPATPDHIIRTKQFPMIGNQLNDFAGAYQDYFTTCTQKNTNNHYAMLDPAPRLILDPRYGLATIGKTMKECKISADIYSHTIDIILRANALGGYKALPQQDLFEVEYWDLEQAKLKKTGCAPPFQGEIALVTGAASGIGKASAEALMKNGAAVIGLDINPAIKDNFKSPDYLGIQCDISDEQHIISAVETAIYHFGGLDMLILNAGIFPKGSTVEKLESELWRQVMAINLDANLVIMRTCYPFMKLAPRTGRMVIIGSKNVPAPGPGAAAYSASKAALQQLARVAALEWAIDKININTLHPNAVFDTAIWTDEVLKSRAQHYGLTVAEYKTNNLLQTEIKSQDVAEMVISLCSDVFSKTTGAQIPIDGGNERVI